MATNGRSLSSLLQQTHLQDDEEILEAATEAVRRSPSDTEAQHVRVVALLKLDRFSEALELFEADKSKLKQRARLEYAYTLYKAGHPERAAEIASQDSARGLQHVEAQASYRAEKFARAAELYQSLSTDAMNDAETDLRVNSGAVDAQLEWIGQGHLVRQRKPAREDLESFEAAYNASCGCIARGELRQAEVFLQRAKSMCMAGEEMTEEEKQSELVPIIVQLTYVLSRLGRHEEAEQLARTVEPSHATDRSTRYIAQVNSFATSPIPANPFLGERLIAMNLDSLKPDYPFTYQRNILQGNQHAVALQALKYDGAAHSTARELAKVAAPTLDARINTLSVVNAAANAKCQTGKEGLKHILPLLKKRPNDVGLVLTIVQLYALAGNLSSATGLLDQFAAQLESSADAEKLHVRYAPGLVGIRVNLFESLGREMDKRAELVKAARYLRDHQGTRTLGEIAMLKAAGRVLLDAHTSDNDTLALSVFKELYAHDPKDKSAVAGLAALSPSSAPRDTEAILTPVDRLIAKVNVDALEEAGIAQSKPSAAATTATANRKRPADESSATKRKKVRKARLPKDHDPNKQPDPERWLPLKDRSTYRPRGKKAKAKQAQFSQGAVLASDTPDGSRPGTPAADVVKSRTAGGAAAKKKKGKSKW